MIGLFVALGLSVKAKVESDNEQRKKDKNGNIQTNPEGESISESFLTNIFFQTMVDRAQKEKQNCYKVPSNVIANAILRPISVSMLILTNSR